VRTTWGWSLNFWGASSLNKLGKFTMQYQLFHRKITCPHQKLKTCCSNSDNLFYPRVQHISKLVARLTDVSAHKSIALWPGGWKITLTCIFITTWHQRVSTSSQHHISHHNVLHRRLIISLHHHIIISLHNQTITLWHHHNISSVHHNIITACLHHVTISSHQYIII